MDAIKQAVSAAIARETAPPKPTLWLLYHRDAYTTARHLEHALKQLGTWTVVTIGPGHDYRDGSKINLAAWAKRLGPPQAILVCDGPSIIEAVGLETFPGPKAYYAIDTHVRPDLPTWIYGYDKVYVAHARTLTEWNLPTLAHLVSAADPSLHQEIPHVPIVYDVAFIGGADLSEVQWRRRELLAELVKPEHGLSVYAGRTTGLWISFLYSKAKLVFNCSVKGDANMRLFEGMACRRVVVTDRNAETEALGLVDGEHCVMYDTKEELIDKVKALLADPERRERIATAGQQWVLAAHTYDHRAKTIIADLTALMHRGERIVEGEKTNAH